MKPLTLVHEFPTGEHVVGIVLFKGVVIIATSTGVYRMRTPRSKPKRVQLVRKP